VFADDAEVTIDFPVARCAGNFLFVSSHSFAADTIFADGSTAEAINVAPEAAAVASARCAKLFSPRRATRRA
jgi:hypothetical protein